MLPDGAIRGTFGLGSWDRRAKQNGVMHRHDRQAKTHAPHGPVFKSYESSFIWSKACDGSTPVVLPSALVGDHP